MLVIVSHDRLFTDKVCTQGQYHNVSQALQKFCLTFLSLSKKVTDHLFVFEGNGIVKDYLGTLSDYAECLIEQENDSASYSMVDSVSDKKSSYKEDKGKRLERKNTIKKLKRELSKIEPMIEKLKADANELQTKIENSSDKGWSILAELTDKMQEINEKVEMKEMEWLEIAEELEGLEEEEETASP